MKKVINKLMVAALMALLPVSSHAQGWPANYDGVMLQGFYWNSYADTQWSYLEGQADELSRYFSLIWVPQSGYCGSGNNMGYMPQYYWNQTSSFGSSTQLRSMISTFKEKGLGTIADVVINHRNNIGSGGSWVDYPVEYYKGTKYQMQSTDICSNDDGGKTKTWATSKGISLSSNADTGEDWSGCRDLDHKSENVNTVIKAYLDYLLNDLGYAGFRYDMVKGYSASFTGDYNSTVNPTFSVGENWSGSNTIKNWILGTKVDNTIRSAAFDFQFRYRVRDAINNSNWSKLSASDQGSDGKPLVFENYYKQYAVTFVENHDMEYRSASEQQDPIKKDTLAANAYLLAMPGTPCIFLKHWQDCKKDLKMMIEARHLAHLTNQSVYTVKGSSTTYYAVATTTADTNDTLLCVVGSKISDFTVPAGYKQLCSGYHYAYYINEASYGDWDTTKARIEEEEKEEPFTPHTATIYLKQPSFTPVYFYAWEKAGTQLNGSWPGKVVTDTKVINGETWYYQTFDISTSDYTFSIIFNKGSGKAQTTDIGNINSDRYYTVTDNGSALSYTDVTNQMTSIVDVKAGSEASSADSRLYDLTGRRIAQPQSVHLYIKGGKKFLAPR